MPAIVYVAAWTGFQFTVCFLHAEPPHCSRDGNGSAGHRSWVKWVNHSEWVMWVTGQYS